MKKFALAKDSSNGKYSAVFEFDGSCYYLYLLDSEKEPYEIIAAAEVTPKNLSREDFQIEWQSNDTIVSLLANGDLLAQISAIRSGVGSRVLTAGT